VLVVPDDVLRLLPDTGSYERDAGAVACRVPGCAGRAQGRLGFCAVCERRYEAITLLRGQLVEALCAKLATLGDPLYAAFGTRRKELGAHVLAHLEELNAIDLRVPASAVEDLVAELDARAHEA